MGETRRRRITIAGAAPGGICTAIRLKEAGVEDFLILERSSRPGGTWARNRWFPNLFMLYGQNTNTGSNLQMLEHEVD